MTEEEKDAYIKKLVQSNIDQQNKIAALSIKVHTLQKAYDKQKEINKELVDENEELEKKREQDCDSSWYEGFNCSEKERLKQIIKAKEIIKELLDFDFLPDIEIKKQAEQFLKDQEE